MRRISMDERVLDIIIHNSNSIKPDPQMYAKTEIEEFFDESQKELTDEIKEEM